MNNLFKARQNQLYVYKQFKRQGQYLIEIQKDKEKLLSFRHDFKRLLLNYQILLKKGDSENVLKDIEDILHNRLITTENTGISNSYIDTLISSRKEICDQKHISLNCRVAVPDTFCDIELMVVLLNLIDNAIEYEKTIDKSIRHITVDIISMPSGLNIIVKNRIINSILKNNLFLYSSKPESYMHGCGIKSVRQLIKNRDGLMDIFEEDNMFCVHIISGID